MEQNTQVPEEKPHQPMKIAVPKLQTALTHSGERGEIVVDSKLIKLLLQTFLIELQIG